MTSEIDQLFSFLAALNILYFQGEQNFPTFAILRFFVQNTCMHHNYIRTRKTIIRCDLISITTCILLCYHALQRFLVGEYNRGN